MSMIAEYEPPTWSRVTSLMFCAQIVGKPVIAPEPAARPTLAAVPFRTVRRLNPLDFGISAWVMVRLLISSAMSASLCCLERPLGRGHRWPSTLLTLAWRHSRRTAPDTARGRDSLDPRRRGAQ